MKTLSVSLVAALLGLVQAAKAGDCCAPCAADCCQADCCSSGCGKICKLVCSTKKITEVCYGCECEDFCVSSGCCDGWACEGCEHCEGIPSQTEPSCGCDDGCTQGPGCDCHLHWKSWIPGCAEMRNKKKLIKYVIEKEVPDYKWEVVDAPCGCGNGGCGDGCCDGGYDSGCSDGGCTDGCTDGGCANGGCTDGGCTADPGCSAANSMNIEDGSAPEGQAVSFDAPVRKTSRFTFWKKK